MEEDEDELSPKEEFRIFLISLPFTAGGFWLLPYLNGVEKSGWVWWPALIGMVFSVAASVIFGISCAGRLVHKWFGLSFGEIISKFIVAIIIAVIYVWLGYISFDAFDQVSKSEVIAFLAGGAVVYFIATRR